MNPMEPQITQRALAKLLSVNVRTLAEWRRKRKGPRGWWRVNPTTFAYPVAEVERWMEECKRASHQLDALDASKSAFLDEYRKKRSEAAEAVR